MLLKKIYFYICHDKIWCNMKNSRQNFKICLKRCKANTYSYIFFAGLHRVIAWDHCQMSVD